MEHHLDLNRVIPIHPQAQKIYESAQECILSLFESTGENVLFAKLDKNQKLEFLMSTEKEKGSDFDFS